MSKVSDQSTAAKTAKNIAYGMISIYGVTLVITGIAAVLKCGEDSKAWMDLFKSGFLLLGGALTTIIGYYFGSRGVQEAQEVAETTREELEQQKQAFDAFKRQFAPMADEDSLIPEGQDLPDN